MGSLDNENMVEEKLKDAGNSLLNPPSSVDELLGLLDEVENLLSHVEQAPSRSMQDALFPTMKALISRDLLKHSDEDVRVSVASCITEITRITAPDAPYNDEQMKEIFQLTVAAFEKLSHVSGRGFRKAVTILDTVAKVRSCLIMLDLECDGLILEMFQLFFKAIRSNHPHSVFSAMEMIMTTVIDESEDISFELLSIVLSSVKKENQDVSPMPWKLGEKVLRNCSRQLKPYLMDAVHSKGLALDMYSPVVVAIVQNECSTVGDQNVVHAEKHVAEETKPKKRTDMNEPNEGTSAISADAAGPGEVCQELDGSAMPVTKVETASTQKKENGGAASTKVVESETKSESVSTKRGRKPNSLMNPEEGYDHPLISSDSKARKKPSSRKTRKKEADTSPLENPVSKNLPRKTLPASSSKADDPGRSSHGKNPSSKRSRLEVKDSVADQYADSTPLSALKKRKSGVQVEKKAAHNVHRRIKIEPEDEHEIATSWKPSGKGGVPIRSDTKKQKSGKSKPSKVVSEAPGKGGVLIRSDVKKQKSGNSKPSKFVVNEASGSKKIVVKTATKSSGRGKSNADKTPPSSVKRKRSIRQEVDSESLDLGEELVGKRIKVWWPLDKRFYEGVVDLYDPAKKKHKVLYTDGETEVLNLKRQRWELIEQDASPKEEDPETDRPDSRAASDSLQKQKKGTEDIGLAPKVKTAGSSARKKRSSTNRSKKKATKSVTKAADGDDSNNLAGTTNPKKNAATEKKGEGSEPVKIMTQKTDIDDLKSLNQSETQRKVPEKNAGTQNKGEGSESVHVVTQKIDMNGSQSLNKSKTQRQVPGNDDMESRQNEAAAAPEEEEAGGDGCDGGGADA